MRILAASDGMQLAARYGEAPESRLLHCDSDPEDVGDFDPIATEPAVRKNTRALVLESPFTTAYCASTGIPVFPFDKFRNIVKIGRSDEPLFILHGDSDEQIVARHSEILFGKRRGPKERHVIKGAGHQDVRSFDLEAELDALDAFVGNQPIIPSTTSP
jgi:fermentation-respiration switch protein FrsA (DUF1100 family)